jgi:regulatory protein
VAREIVLGKLTAQARTRHELAETLQQRNIGDDAAQNVLDRMEEVGLVDDAEFARSWVESRQRRRRLSKRALSVELARKGVDRDLADAAVDQVESEDEYAAARELAWSKAVSLTGLDRPVQYRRLAGALARRGFGTEVSQQVISEVLDRARHDESMP